MLRPDTAAPRIASLLAQICVMWPSCVAVLLVVSLLSSGARVAWAANFVDLNAIDPNMGSGNGNCSP